MNKLMRHLRCALAAMVLILIGFNCPAQFDFQISGQVHGREKGTLALREQRSRSGDYIEVPFENGKFVYKGRSTDIKFFNVALLEDVLKGSYMPFPIILEPGSTEIEITLLPQVAELTPLRVSFKIVNELNTQLLKYNTVKERLRERRDLMEKQGYSQSKINKFNKESIDTLKQLAISNSDNVLGLFIVYPMTEYFSDSQIKSVLSNVPQSLRKSKYYKILYSEYIAKADNSVGNKIIDFELPDRNGTLISVSTVAARNQYTLLEFWGSWCGPCIQNARFIVPMYEKYKNHNFEIYGIAFETSKERWINAMDREGYKWTNVIENENDNQADLFISKLLNPENIIPFNILVDSDMKVVAKNLSVDDLEKVLSKLK